MNHSAAKTSKLAICAMLTAVALIFSYVEFLIPISFGIPGIKAGLANIVIVICLYSLNVGSAFFVNLARIALSALLFGNAFSLVYAICGALFSMLVMIVTKKCKVFSVVGVSMAGGVSHNIAQLLAAAAVMQTPKIFGYFPVLLISGMASGIFTGFVAYLVIRSVKNVEKK